VFNTNGNEKFKVPYRFKICCEIKEKARKMVRNQAFLSLFDQVDFNLDKHIIEKWYLSKRILKFTLYQ